MISRRQIIESNQKLNAQCYLLERQQQQQQVSKNIVPKRSQNSRQVAQTKMVAKTAEVVFSRSSNKDRQLGGNSKQFSAGQQKFDMKLAQDLHRFNKCFHDDNFPHEDLEEDGDEIDNENENENGNQEEDNDDEDEFRAQKIHQQRNNKHNRLNNSSDIHEDYRHFDPYSIYGEEDEEEDVWYSEERLFEVGFIVVFLTNNYLASER